MEGFAPELALVTKGALCSAALCTLLCTSGLLHAPLSLHTRRVMDAPAKVLERWHACALSFVEPFTANAASFRSALKHGCLR